MSALALAGARAQPTVLNLPRENRDAVLQKILEPIREKQALPALASAVVTSDGLQAIAAVGVRKVGTHIAVTPDDQWHLGSDTKIMTATMLAQLVLAGKLKWTSSIEEIFPQIAPSLSADVKKITLEQLLHHTAGLPHDADWDALDATHAPLPVQRIGAVKQLEHVKLGVPPGTKFVYSNWGYVIAAAMGEAVAGKPWETLMRERIFGPLHMTSVGFGGSGTIGKIDQPWPHFATGLPTPINGPAMDNRLVMAPAGGVHCSLADWAKFIADQLRGARGEPALLPADSYKVLQTPPSGEIYAMGWGAVPRTWAFGKALTHTGSNTMNTAVAWLAPKRDFAVLICTDQGGAAAEKACDEVASTVIRAP